MTGYTVRAGRPGDLELLAAIDDDASQLFARVGLHIVLAADDPFVRLERERWLASLERGQVLLAEDESGAAVGFAASGLVDGAPYLEQLSVRPSFMRRGLGSDLLTRATGAVAPGRALWLTTYGHLPFNKPFYERAGFQVVPESGCGPELCAILALQRKALPRPEQRVAMRRVC
jgi:GNAT superfamily N-acetyltransferase